MCKRSSASITVSLVHKTYHLKSKTEHSMNHLWLPRQWAIPTDEFHEYESCPSYIIWNNVSNWIGQPPAYATPKKQVSASRTGLSIISWLERIYVCMYVCMYVCIFIFHVYICFFGILFSDCVPMAWGSSTTQLTHRLPEPPKWQKPLNPKPYTLTAMQILSHLMCSYGRRVSSHNREFNSTRFASTLSNNII
jgi:hypothetical protein